MRSGPGEKRTRPAGSSVGATLAYDADDDSAAARSWRNDTVVKLAAAFLAANRTYVHSRRTIHTRPGDATSAISVADLAFAFELGLGDLGAPRRMFDTGIGVQWHGIGFQQGVTDLAMLHETLWRVRPSLLIEVGSWCGGSAVFFAKSMLEYEPKARVLTFDTIHPEKRWECKQLPGSQWYHSLNPNGPPAIQSPFWAELKGNGTLAAILGDPTKPRNLETIAREVATRGRGGVMIIDDGDHLATPLVSHFATLSRFVSPASYYLIQDTRLDSDCAYQLLTNRKPWNYCKNIVLNGGPAAAVQRIMASEPFRSNGWRQDRRVEKWAVTQHPGGYLQRVPAQRPPAGERRGASSIMEHPSWAASRSDARAAGGSRSGASGR